MLAKGKTVSYTQWLMTKARDGRLSTRSIFFLRYISNFYETLDQKWGNNH